MSIVKGETMPVFQAEAVCSGNVSMKLDKESEYTIQNLVDELNQGIGYTLSSEGDGSIEGNFPIKVEFSDDISKAFEKWHTKIRVDVEAGNLYIKNQYGEWEGEKFKRWDGSYVNQNFITYQNKTYYFDAEGNKSTGWQDIEYNRYYFDESGVMQKGWLRLEENVYYLNENNYHTTRIKDISDFYVFDGNQVVLKKNISRDEAKIYQFYA